MDMRPAPRGRKRVIHVHLSRGFPEGSPTDHPNESVVDVLGIEVADHG
jgi:hypothetical protein